MQLDPDQFADIVATAIKLAMQPLVARITVLERREAVPGPEGKPGRDGETVVGPQGEMGLTGPKGDQGPPGTDVDETVIVALQTEIKALRSHLDEAGQYIGLDIVADLVKSAVADAVAVIPAPHDGKDGSSVTLEDVAPLVKSAVADVVASLPVPKDGAPGKDGEPGPAGKDANPVVLKAFEAELQALRNELELKTAAPVMTVQEAEEISQSVEALFRKELGIQESRVPRKQKRVLRDADGKIDRVVEEVVP